MNDLPKPWLAVEDQLQRERLERELASELPRGHLLERKKVRVIGRRADQDDVLFEVDGSGYAVVHLTWTGRQEEAPDWPRVTMFESLEDFRRGLWDGGAWPVQDP